MIEAQAIARGVRTSAQKAGLVCDLIRGKDVNQALATLQFTRKIIARELAKVLRSAVANAQQKEGFGGDVERLYVKRTAHLTVRLAERPLKIAQVAEEGETTAEARSPRARKTKAGVTAGARKTAARKAAAAKA